MDALLDFASWTQDRVANDSLSDDQAAAVGMLLALTDQRIEDVDLLLDSIGTRSACYALLLIAGSMADTLAAVHNTDVRELLVEFAKVTQRSRDGDGAG